MNNQENKTILGLIISIILILIATYFFSQAECEAKSISFEESKFSIVGGCMVKHQGKWLPLENIRGFGDE